MTPQEKVLGDYFDKSESTRGETCHLIHFTFLDRGRAAAPPPKCHVVAAAELEEGRLCPWAQIAEMLNQTK